MNQQLFYQTKKDTIEDVMRFAAILIDANLEPQDVLKHLDKYLSHNLDTIDNTLNQLQNVEPKSF